MSPLICWFITAAVLLSLAAWLGRQVQWCEQDSKGAWVVAPPTLLGILIDDRKRFSLAHFQLVAWGLVLTSLVAAVVLARLLAGVAPGELLNIAIPTNLLALAGLAGGSTVLATAVKATKNTDQVQAKSGKTQFHQMFMVEEGDGTDKVVDPAKFQNFMLTIIALAGYIALAVGYLASTNLTRAGAPAALPDFYQGLLYLVGVSQSAYVAAKIPNQQTSDDGDQAQTAPAPAPVPAPAAAPATVTAAAPLAAATGGQS